MSKQHLNLRHAITRHCDVHGIKTLSDANDDEKKAFSNAATILDVKPETLIQGSSDVANKAAVGGRGNK